MAGMTATGKFDANSRLPAEYADPFKGLCDNCLFLFFRVQNVSFVMCLLFEMTKFCQSCLCKLKQEDF